MRARSPLSGKSMDLNRREQGQPRNFSLFSSADIAPGPSNHAGLVSVDKATCEEDRHHAFVEAA